MTKMAERNDYAESKGWKEYHRDMVSNMSLERLREAMKRREIPRLERAIDECDRSEMNRNCRELLKAKEMVDALHDKDELKKALERKNPQEITEELQRIRRSPSHKYLQREVQEANYSLTCLEWKQDMNHKRKLLEMDKKTMSELRRYHYPPRGVHKVIQATLLLLGEDEATTEDWKVCQKICNPQGRDGLNRKVMEFDVAKVSPELAARARVILQKVQLSQVQAASSGVGTFYVWAMGAVEEVLGGARGGGPPPATIKRQRQILERAPITSPRRERKTSRDGFLSPRSSTDYPAHDIYIDPVQPHTF